ncbi:MAG: glycoside hydrolase family 2 TIM barrel-domain containing protein [Bacteroidota bacterium]
MRFVLEFEGVHQVTDLWVNGRHVGQHAVGGYTPFHFDVTEFVRPGDTAIIVVKADNSANEYTPPDPHNTDYIKFGGIYRDVYLTVTNPLHVTRNYEAFDAGVHLTTPSVRKHDATVVAKTTVRNENPEPVEARLVTRLISADGVVLKKLEARTQVPGNGQYSFRQSTILTENLRLWSPDDPYLYRVHSTLYAGDEPVDFVENSLGIRWFKLVDGHKFLLNGDPLWLVGVNRHQNYPIIGDATPDALGEAEAQQYKDAGMNCIRLSHYTQDESFLAACDRLGLLVYEEAPTWIDWGDQQWWDNLEAALRTTIRAHRNHPSIIIWGAGINHRGDVPMMHLAAKEEDPWRLTASASSNGWTGRPNAGVTDVYATMDYRNAILPDGDWALSMEHRNNHDAEANQLVISRYRKTPRTFGALAWVGADYNQALERRGKVSYRSRSGILDHFRVPRPVYHWYRAEYGKEPMVHIADERGSYDGIVRVYARAEEVALYHDGRLIDQVRPERGDNKNHLQYPTFYFYHDFTAGTLEARALVSGKVVATHQRTKAGTPTKVEVNFGETPRPFAAGGSDVRIVHARITDEAGNLVSTAEHPLTYRIVSGPGELIDDPNKDIHPARPEFGQAGMYVRGTAETGEIIVEVSTPGLAPGRASITTVPYQADALAEVAPFRELSTVRLDIGGEGTLNEIGWTPAAKSQIPLFENAELSIAAEDMEWSKNATMFGNLSYVGTDGVYTSAREFTLTFRRLPEGTYHLKTYHHPRTKGPLLDQVAFSIVDAEGEREQRGRKAAMGYWDNVRLLEQEPLSGEVRFTSDGEKAVKIQVRPVGDKPGAFWLNGLTLGQIQ